MRNRLREHLTGHPWRQVVAVSCLLAWAALVSNIQPMAQLEGQANVAKAVRLVFSYLLSSGTAWAGLPVLAGWLVTDRWRSMLAGTFAAELSLVVHYETGMLIGVFDAGIWADNAYWFFFGLLCAPLGMVGALARRADLWGLLARLVVPVGALLEPFHRGVFTAPAILPWPKRVAPAISGAVLVAAGVTGAVLVLLRWLSPRRDLRVQQGA